MCLGISNFGRAGICAGSDGTEGRGGGDTAFCGGCSAASNFGGTGICIGSGGDEGFATDGGLRCEGGIAVHCQCHIMMHG